jgi:hypothetical protein
MACCAVEARDQDRQRGSRGGDGDTLIVVEREPRERLAKLLGMTNKRDAFSARRTAAPEDLQIDIAGVGALTIPVSAVQARKLWRHRASGAVRDG